MSSVAPEAGIIYGLYCTCHPERGIRYIGRTLRTTARRINEHRYQSRSGGCYPVHNWIRKHGEENIAIEALEVVALAGLAKAECRWMEHFMSKGDLLNVILAEQEVYIRPESVRKKIGDKHRGKIVSQATRAKMSLAKAGKTLPQSQRDRMSLSQRGVGNAAAKISEQDVLDIRKANLDGESQYRIAERYGMSQSAVSAIVTRRTWGHV